MKILTMVIPVKSLALASAVTKFSSQSTVSSASSFTARMSSHNALRNSGRSNQYGRLSVNISEIKVLVWPDS